MAIDITTDVLIRRPRREVAAFMFDPRNDTRWTKNVIDARPLGDGPLRAGSKVERTVRFLGRTFSYEYEVIDGDADGFVELRVERPFPMQVRYQLDDAEGGTRASIRARGEAGGFFRLAGPLLAKMVKRNIHADLEALKTVLET